MSIQRWLPCGMYMCVVFSKYSPFSRKLGTWKKLWSNLGLALFAYQLGFCKTCVESPNKYLSMKTPNGMQTRLQNLGTFFFYNFFYVQKGFENINVYKIRRVPGWLMPLHCYSKTSAKDSTWMGLPYPLFGWDENCQ